MRQFSTAMMAENTMYTSGSTAESILDALESTQSTDTESTGPSFMNQSTGTYVFKNAEDYEAFASEVYDMGLSENYTVYSEDINSYESSLIPLNNINDFAFTLLIVGTIILVVLNAFNIRERKYEIRVLTAIGMKKKKVITQFLIELLIVSMLAIAIGTVIGSVASTPISNTLLDLQITSLQNQQTTQMENFGGNAPGGAMIQMNGASNNTNYVDEIDTRLDVEMIFQLFFIGFLLSGLSSLVSATFISRYDRLKILSDRT